MHIEVSVRVRESAPSDAYSTGGSVLDVRSSESIPSVPKPQHGDPDYGQPRPAHPWRDGAAALRRLIEEVADKAERGLADQRKLDERRVRALADAKAPGGTDSEVPF